MKKTEILAPAGSFESLVAVVNASCDAVYIGGQKFGARAYADNFGEENIQRAIDYAHVHNKKIYLTVNTLLKNSEIENELFDYLNLYYGLGIDAVIVQDAGVLQFIHENFSNLPIHASTQMSLTMAAGAEVLKAKGVTRLVNGRELGLAEIKAIRRGTDLEIESFVHGALCYCYSGQCLMSSMFGGRSGNRGRCAQPCRMPYQLRNDKKEIMKEEEKYLLSPKDICTIELIPQLIDAGIDSFKIEGRMKRPEYAAGVTHAYRKYVDKYYELGSDKYNDYLRNHKDEFQNDIKNLKDLYNRGGFSRGYYENRNSGSMLSLSRPNHSGVLIGKVLEVQKNRAKIGLTEDINAQDILEIREGTANLYEFTVKTKENKGNAYCINLYKDSTVNPGNPVFRTKNNVMLEGLSKRYLTEEIKEPITGHMQLEVGKPLSLRINCRDTTVLVTGDIVEEAKNQPMTEDKFLKQLTKTKETSYSFKEITFTMEGNVFVPVQKLNELRREGLTILSLELAKKHRREKREKGDVAVNPPAIKNHSSNLGINVLVNTKEQFMAACSIKEVTSVYLESDMVSISKITELTSLGKQYEKNCYIVLPYIFRQPTYDYFKQNKTVLEDNTIDGYILRNYEEYSFVKTELNLTGKILINDYNFYVMNQSAVRFFKELGVEHFCAPVELNYYELKELKGVYSELIVYGRLPLMISAQCLIKTSTGGNNSNYSKVSETPCCGIGMEQIELIDRYQKGFQVKRHCRECYNTIYNSISLSLLNNSKEVLSLSLNNIRLNFTMESGDETKEIIQKFVDVYLQGKSQVEEMFEFTRGHFKRGVE